MRSSLLFLCALLVRAQSVVVTGTAQPVPLEEADRSVTVLSDMPQKSPLFGGFFELLQLDSSIDLQQRQPGVQGDITIRGGTFGQTLVLIDGIRINDVQTGHHNMDLPVPLDAIGEVQILQGSGSTFYGSDAVSGVVNVITRVEEPGELVFRSALGSFGTNAESGFFSFLAGPLSQQFSFERTLSDGFEDDREYRSTSGSSESILHTKWGTTRILLSALDRPFGANQFYGDYDSWERTKTWYAAVHQNLGDNTELSFSYRRHTDLFVLLRDDPQYYTNRHADQSYDAAARRHNDLTTLLRLSYGVEGIEDSIISNNLGIHMRRQGAVYTNLDMRALKRFSLSVGGREQFYGHQQAFFAPTVSGGAWLSQSVKVRASVSRAFRLPTYTELYYSDPSDLPNPNLKPEQATSYEAGIDWHLRSHWRAFATVFDRDEKNGIDYVRSSPAVPWQAENFDRLRFTGVESGVEGNLAHSQKISVQFTAIHGALADEGGLQSEYAFNFPTQNAVVSWQILTAKGLLARTRLGVVRRYQMNPYALWDASVAWTSRRIRPYLQLTNLTNTDYQEIMGVNMPGRAALVGVEIQAWKRR
ncbi:MAG: TonB-dependent receptor [Bryobacteraceae bacterium]